jgi:isopenicillin N synthase-like dioxygenase
MFISPEILSMTIKERKKIDKVYYKRGYTETPSELQKTQKDYEKELALQNKQKEQKGQNS